MSNPREAYYAKLVHEAIENLEQVLADTESDEADIERAHEEVAAAEANYHLVKGGRG